MNQTHLFAKNYRNRRSWFVSALFPLLLAQSISCHAANLTAPQLNLMLKDPNLKISASSTVVMGSGPLVTVLAEEDAKNPDQDLKIDALFLSKTLMEGAPGQIETVKVLFSQSGRDGRYIVISNREIQDFSKGKITPDKMLASLRLMDVEPERAPDVLPGAQFERRLLVWNRIKKLRQQGTGVTPFENIFKEIEASVKAGETTKIGDKVNFIESKLTDQEEQVKQAKKSLRGHGVPAAASSQHALNSAATAATATATATAASAGGTTYVPPDADRIKRIYMQDSDSWIREVNAKNRTHGEKMRSLKQEINARFGANQAPAAFELIGQMLTVVRQDLGIDPVRPDGQGQNSGQQGGQGGPQGGGPGGGPQGGGPGGGPQGGGPGGGPPGGGQGPKLLAPFAYFQICNGDATHQLRRVSKK